MAKIFLSHASADRAIAAEVHAWLKGEGHEVFLSFDHEDGITAGEDWYHRLSRELGGCDALVALLSQSWNASYWCFAEWVAASVVRRLSIPMTITPWQHTEQRPHVAAVFRVQGVAWHSGGDERAKLRRALAEVTVAETQPPASSTASVTQTGTGNIAAQASGHGNTINIYATSTGTAPKRISTLPARVKDFTGRAADLVRLAAILTASGRAAVSAVGGMGGIGKTSLALEVAHAVAEHFPSGALFLNLRGQSDRPMTPVEAMSAILGQLGHTTERLPDTAEALQPHFLGALAGECLLLVLDDACDASQVESLLPPEPVALLVTSRNRLALHDVDQLDLEILPEGEAVDFLCGLLGPNRASDSELRLLTERCGRLPIALRAAGVLLRDDPTLPLADYLADLASERTRLAALQVPDNTALDVRLVLAHSVTALERQDATLASRWQQLAAFPASFDSAAAAAVWDAGTTAPSILGQAWSWARGLVGLGEAPSTFRHRDPRRDLTSLVRRSLLLHDTTTDRFRLHDLYRDLASRGLEPAEQEAAAERFAGFYGELHERANESLRDGHDGVMRGLRAFDLERANIELAQRWATQNLARVDAAARWLATYGLWRDVLELRLTAKAQVTWLEAAVSGTRKARLRTNEGAALGNLGNAWNDLGEARKAIGLFEQHLVIAREIGDRRGEGNALGNLGNAWADLGEARKAIGFYEQLLVIFREIGDRRGEGASLGNLGVAWKNLGEARKAVGFYEQHLVIAREIGDRRGEGNALWNSALAHETEGERGRAIELAKAALVIRRQIEDPWTPKVEAKLREWGVDPDSV